MDRYKILLGRSAPKVSKTRPRKKVTRKKKPTLEEIMKEDGWDWNGWRKTPLGVLPSGDGAVNNL
jgi:hypothetical protein